MGDISWQRKGVGLCVCGCGVAVGVEESSERCVHFWEVWVSAGFSGVPLLVVVDNMVCIWGEEGGKLLVSEDLIEDKDFINGWLGTLISNSSQGGEREEGEVQFPDESVWSHEESKGSVANKASGPSII